MKKIFLILALALYFNPSYASETENFINPIFYKTLHSMGTKGDTVKITPTTYQIKNYYGYETSANCELLENEIHKVTLKCLHLPADTAKKELIIVGPNEKPKSWIYKFIIPEKDEQIYHGGLRVILYDRLSWEKEEDSISYENFIIYNSEED